MIERHEAWMRALLKTAHVVLSLIVVIAAVNLAFVAFEGFWVLSGRIQPGETLEYFERPAGQLGELGMRGFVILAVIFLALLAQRRLKRWSKSMPHDTSLKR